MEFRFRKIQTIVILPEFHQTVVNSKGNQPPPQKKKISLNSGLGIQLVVLPSDDFFRLPKKPAGIAFLLFWMEVMCSSPRRLEVPRSSLNERPAGNFWGSFKWRVIDVIYNSTQFFSWQHDETPIFFHNKIFVERVGWLVDMWMANDFLQIPVWSLKITSLRCLPPVKGSYRQFFVWEDLLNEYGWVWLLSGWT